MDKRSTVRIALGGLAILFFGVTVGLYSQSASLTRFAEEKANISKMDWILLISRVHVLEQALKDDLALPLTPTSYSYDSEKQQIRIVVHVSPSWLAESTLDQVNKALLRRAASLCITPMTAEHGEWSFKLLETPPIEYCAVRFFTIGFNSAGELEARDVATFEGGKLVMK